MKKDKIFKAFYSLKKIYRYPTGKISLTLIAVVIVLIVMNSVCFKNIGISDYTTGIVTELIGIIITIGFIQVIFDKKADNDIKQAEKQAILRNDKIIQQYIEHYSRCFISVSTPMENDDNMVEDMPNQFRLSDMRDLHKPSVFMMSNMTKPAVENFFEIELIIREHMIAMINNINFNYYKDVETIFLEFINKSILHDVRGSLLSAENETIRKIIINDGEDFLDKFLKGEVTYAHVLLPYAHLHTLMNKERDLIEKYNSLVNKL